MAQEQWEHWTWSEKLQHEQTLAVVTIEGQAIGNVYSFEYLGSRMKCDGDDKADVRFRIEISQATFRSLSRSVRISDFRRIWISGCTLARYATRWPMPVRPGITLRTPLRGFNNLCMHSITGQEYMESAINPRNNLMLTIRKRRLRYLGHILRMDENRLVRRTLAVYVNACSAVPEGSLLQD